MASVTHEVYGTIVFVPPQPAEEKPVEEDNRDVPKKPIKDPVPRYGMGYEYNDWICPRCSKFLAYEPNINGIPRRCQGCGQLIEKPTREDGDGDGI